MYLVHHGIKGQKWGIRRYQNEDGTLTRAGKERYSDDSGKDYKPNKFVDSRSNHTHGGTSGKINSGRPTYYSPTKYDRGRNNREEEYRRENWNADRKNVDSLNRRIKSTLPGDSIIQGPVGSQEFRVRQREIENKRAEGRDQSYRHYIVSDDLYKLGKKESYSTEKVPLPEGGYKYYPYRDNKVSTRVNENKERQTARESTLQAPGSDTMERANIADAKGPYMSDEYRRELEYNSKKNQYPSVGSDGAPEFDIPNESERARERAKKEYEEWYDKYNKEVTKYITPYQDIEFVDIDQFESNPRNKITPDLDGKASSGQATIKQYNDRSKDHTSKSYKDQHSIDTNLNSQLANIQKRDYSEHIHAAVQRGIKEVTSIISNILTKNKTKTDNKKRK